jgi:putative ABC transport system ATP-binding protein
MNAPIAVAEQLLVRYRTQDPPVLNGIDLSVEKGEHLAIMGPSGCGKSTLLAHLAGLRRPEAGRVFLCGQELDRLTGADLDRLRARLLGFVFQRACLLPYLSVRENIALAFEPLQAPGADERKALVEAVMAPMGLTAISGRRAADLSVGEAQRVAVARALVKAPTLLIADEPTGALDGANVGTIADLLCGDSSRTVIIATHDERLAARCQRIIYLRSGILCAQ